MPILFTNSREILKAFFFFLNISNPPVKHHGKLRYFPTSVAVKSSRLRLSTILLYKSNLIIDRCVRTYYNLPCLVEHQAL